MAMQVELVAFKSFGTVVDVLDDDTSTWFVVNYDLVREWGTSLYYDVFDDHGYMDTSRGHVSLLSYENFGSDYNAAAVLAAHWCERAKLAWEFVQSLPACS